MWRAIAIEVLSFPFTALAFIAGWAFRDIRFGVLAGAVVFTIFFIAALASIFFIRTYSYTDSALPPVFALLWSAVLAPFSFGGSLFSAPAFIGAGIMLGACMAMAKRYAVEKKWLLFPALVFLYEMLPVNIPGQFDDMFALTGAAGYLLALFLRRVLPGILADLAGRRKAG
ncbi:MAG: hypothetical protein A2234_04275 [Elusimicrobia bacterium RIFOXYA2_FULL_58_8]|nr:MAG: hypothetical protein A2285_01090 [Elusimicrobia bacterium RIFOXYA12_FULL_57_11]OGS16337.1 MAG: hypothetical protein A2234_04275 [Elusimicrobia bacterium RIFOXYA2_FULL_58_8]